MNTITVRTKGVDFDHETKHTVDDDGIVTIKIDGDKVDPFDLAARLQRAVYRESMHTVDQKLADTMSKAFNEIMARREANDGKVRRARK